MEYKTREGIIISGNDGQDQFLAKLYGSVLGRMMLKILTRPAISKIGGVFLSSSLSKGMIKPFVEKNGIDMTQYEEKKYFSYNDFFSRKIKKEARKIDQDPDHLISPCDGKLTVYPIQNNGSFIIKQTPYTVESLLQNNELAKRYEGGYALVFRLTVDDYHRYFYVDDGTKSKNHRIPGVFHTVNPIANDFYPIYKENTREYSLLKSRHFGTILVMEVGALMVGKIVNHHQDAYVRRGQEKGYFEFGGSTIVLLLEKNKVCLDQDILDNSENQIETIVKAGEKIGELPETTGQDINTTKK